MHFIVTGDCQLIVAPHSAIKGFFAYWIKRDEGFDPTQVDERTPYFITTYMTQKCGEKEKGFEGLKVSPTSPASSLND